MAPSTKCGSCKKAVTKTDMGVECDMCNLWYHAACMNISNDLYAYLCKNENLSYNCTGCLANTSTVKNNSFIAKGFEELNKKFISCFGTFTAELRAEQQVLKNLIENKISDIRSDLTNSLCDLKKNIDECNEKIKKVEDSTISKLSKLNLENNKLQRRLNRGDIIVSGLPAKISHLIDPVLAICSYYKVDAVAQDVNHCNYIHRGKSILIKFNNVFVRDKVLRAYYRNPIIQLKNIIETDLTTRVYINANLTPEETKLQNLCKKMRKDGKISRFKILNTDVPMAKLKLIDDSEETVDLVQALSLRDKLYSNPE